MSGITADQSSYEQLTVLSNSEVGPAFIQLVPGGARPDEAALDAFCRERLAAYKVPRRFHFVAEFPRTSAGKIQKHLLA